MSVIKRLFKHSFIYAIGSVVQSAVGFLLIPVYTRYLSTSEYGYLEILNTFTSILLMVLSMGFASAILKTYFRDTGSDEERKNLVGTAFTFVLPIALFATVLIFAFGDRIGGFLLRNPGYGWLIKISISYTFFMVFMNLGLALLRAQERSVKYTIVNLARFFIVLALNLYFVIGLKWGLAGVLWGNCISYVLVTLSLLPDVLRNANFKINKPILRKLLAFGFPLIPASIAMWIMDLSDRYMLQFFRSATETGLYSAGYKFGYLINIALVAPFQLAWPTIYFKIAERKDANKIYSRVMTYFVAGGLGLALLLALLANDIFRSPIVGKTFYAGHEVVPVIALAYIIYGMHFILVPGLHIKEKTKLYPLMVIIPALANILMNLYAVPRYGMYGATITTLLSFILVAIITQFITRKYYKVIYNNKKIATAFVLAIGIFALQQLFIPSDLNIYLSVTINVFLALGYFGSLFVTGIISKQKLNNLKSIIV